MLQYSLFLEKHHKKEIFWVSFTRCLILAIVSSHTVKGFFFGHVAYLLLNPFWDVATDAPTKKTRKNKIPLKIEDFVTFSLGLLIFKFGSRIICVFAKKGEMQNTLYQPLSNAFCVLRSECSQKTHMTSN